MLTFQRAQQQQAEEIADLLNGAAEKLLQNNIPQWEQRFEVAAVAEEIAAGHVWVAVQAGEVVATVSLKEAKRLPWFHRGGCKNYYLYSLAVRTDRQGSGVGAQVLGFVKEYARQKGVHLYLDCYYKNEKLKVFYSENGFAPLGDYPEEGYFVSVFCFNELGG